MVIFYDLRILPTWRQCSMPPLLHYVTLTDGNVEDLVVQIIQHHIVNKERKLKNCNNDTFDNQKNFAKCLPVLAVL